MTETIFQVQLDIFTGPLELLLNLVEEKKLHISQVSLAAVADGFVEYLQHLEGEHKDQLADFILVASTLLLIKSRALLPELVVSAEEEGSMAELEARLKLYQRVRELSRYLREQYGRKIVFPSRAVAPIEPIFSPTVEITLPNLLTALESVIRDFPTSSVLPAAVIKKVISLEEVITDLTRRVQTALKLSFRDFTRDRADRTAVIVSFLGMLELVKRGIVSVEQSAHFEDIAIETADPCTVPRYV